MLSMKPLSELRPQDRVAIWGGGTWSKWPSRFDVIKRVGTDWVETEDGTKWKTRGGHRWGTDYGEYIITFDKSSEMEWAQEKKRAGYLRSIHNAIWESLDTATLASVSAMISQGRGPATAAGKPE